MIGLDNIRKKKETGFTLLEFLIYIIIVGMVLVTFGQVGLDILFAKARLEGRKEIIQNARFVLERIREKIGIAEAINSPPQASSSTTLSLEMLDPLKDPLVFDLIGESITIKEGEGERIVLTSEEVRVSNLQFSNSSYPSGSGTVRIEITIRLSNPSNRPEYDIEETFYTTASIKK